jgi:hypothetical protein
MPLSPLHPARVNAARRRAEALRLRALGRQYQEIGRHLGVSKQRAFQLVADGLRDMLAESRELARTLLAQELRRTEELWAFYHARYAANPTPSVAEALLRVAAIRARLLDGVGRDEEPDDPTEWQSDGSDPPSAEGGPLPVGSPASDLDRFPTPADCAAVVARREQPPA